MSVPSGNENGASPLTWASALVGLALLAALVAVGVFGWISFDDVDIGVNGYVAMALGVLGVVGLGGALMALVFYSHRYGYDDQVGRGADEKYKRD
jgi:hypothetical protein